MITRWNYETLSEYKKTNRMIESDVIGQTHQRDPFYITPGRQADAQWFTDIVDEHFPADKFPTFHTRRVHYYIQNNDRLGIKLRSGIPYQNLTAHYNKLNDACKDARYLGLVDPDRVVDQRNRETDLYVTYTFADDLSPSPSVSYETDLSAYVQFTEYDDRNVQAYHCELFVEKSTVEDILVPLCTRYGVNLTVGSGNTSFQRVREMVARIVHARRPARIFYISDFDRAGRSMPLQVARMCEFLIQKAGIEQEVKLEPIVLTAKQLENEYKDLPKSFDKQSTELDSLVAIYPGELDRIVEGWFGRYIDLKKQRDARSLIEEWRGKQRAMAQETNEKYEEFIGELERATEALAEQMQGDLQNRLEQGEVPPALPEAKLNETDGKTEWFFDSTRDYFDQIKYYQKSKDGNG